MQSIVIPLLLTIDNLFLEYFVRRNQRKTFLSLKDLNQVFLRIFFFKHILLNPYILHSLDLYKKECRSV